MITDRERQQQQEANRQEEARIFGAERQELMRLCPHHLVLDDEHLRAIVAGGPVAGRGAVINRHLVAVALSAMGFDDEWIARAMQTTAGEVRQERGRMLGWTPSTADLAPFGDRIRETYAATGSTPGATALIARVDGAAR